jgi:hypothetical protein
MQLTADQVSSVTGLYWDRENDDFLRVYQKDGSLRGRNGNGDFVLKPVNESHFQLANTPVSLTLEIMPNGSRRLVQKFQTQRPIFYEPIESSDPTGTQLVEYCGDFTTKEIDPVYHITLQNDVLMISWLKHPPTVLEPRNRDTFSATIGTIRFTRDPNQKLSGFVLDSNDIHNLNFTRRSQ